MLDESNGVTHGAGARIASAAFCPPNPAESDRATRTVVLPGPVRHEVQVARRVGFLQIDGRRDDAVAHRQEARRRFDRPGGSECVTEGSLDRADRDPVRVVPQDGLEGDRFHRIVIGGPRPVGTHVVDRVRAAPSVAEGGRRGGRQPPPLTVGRGQMDRVGAGGVAGDLAEHRRPTARRRLRRFQDQERRPLSERQARPVPRKGTHPVRRQSLQGGETGKRKLADGVHAACHHQVRPTGRDPAVGQPDGIGPRRTGGGHGQRAAGIPRLPRQEGGHGPERILRQRRGVTFSFSVLRPDVLLARRRSTEHGPDDDAGAPGIERERRDAACVSARSQATSAMRHAGSSVAPESPNCSRSISAATWYGYREVSKERTSPQSPSLRRTAMPRIVPDRPRD